MARTQKYDFTPNEIVDYIIVNRCSIRQAALHFGCSKDVIFTRLKMYNGFNKEELKNILNDNVRKSRF